MQDADVEQLVSAVKGGDLKYLKEVFAVCEKDEVCHLVRRRHPQSALVRRPSNGRELHVREPTLLMVAVAGWYDDVLEYLASFEVRKANLISRG